MICVTLIAIRARLFRCIVAPGPLAREDADPGLVALTEPGVVGTGGVLREETDVGHLPV